MGNFFKNWNFLRIIRLLAGGGLLLYGYSIADWPLMLVGTVLGLMAVTNRGCSPFTGQACEIEQPHEHRLPEDHK